MGRTGTMVLALGLGLAGCHATKFVSPDKPDLYKVPYDFAPAGDSGADFAGVDLASTDLAHREHHDLSASADLHVGDVDLSVLDDLASAAHD